MYPLALLVLGEARRHLPARSSKTSEKLVLLPETSENEDGRLDGFDEDGEDEAPPNDEELRRRRQKTAGGKSEAERLPKAQRTSKAHLARVTAYCTAASYRLRSTAEFVRDQHGAKTKLYDDCLYCVYQLPLLGGGDGFRVRSSPVLKNPGGRSVLDEQIEANEQRQYREGWQGESAEYSVRGNESSLYSQVLSTDGEHETRDRRTAMQKSRRTHKKAKFSPNTTKAPDERVATRFGVGFPSPQAGVKAGCVYSG